MDKFTTYVRQFEEAEQTGQDSRAEAERCRDYYDGDQFTAAEIALLQKRKQPITPENLIKPKVLGLLGLERQSRTDPKAYPRTQVHEHDANTATDSLRYVGDDQDINVKKSAVFENMLIEGYGGVEVAVRKLKDGTVDPFIVHIAFDRLYYDPHSRAADFSDATFTGYVTWMDEAEALRFCEKGGKWAGKEDIIKATMGAPFSSSFASFDDKPTWASWSDAKRKRIRINTHYHLVAGVWHRCVFTLSGELEESAPVPFLDDEGNPENPLIMQSAYIDRENTRYGIVRDMLPLQDEVNKRRSKFLNMVSSTKVRVSRSAGQDKESIRKEMARPDGVIVAEYQEVEELGNLGKDAGQFQIFMDTRQTLKGNIGPNAYLSGKQGEGQSGRAILAQQQAGMTEMAPILDNLRHFTLRLYRQVWNRIRQYWTGERFIRVTDDDKNLRFVVLNQAPALSPEQALDGAAKVQRSLQMGEIDQETAVAYIAEIERLARVQNPVAELDVDIDIDEVPDSPTLQAEQYEQLMQFMGNGLMAGPDMLKLVIQASSLRDKDRLLDIVEKMGAPPPEPQAPDPAQELALRGAAAEVAGKEADAVKTQAETLLAQAKARTEQAKGIALGLHGVVGLPQPPHVSGFGG